MQNNDYADYLSFCQTLVLAGGQIALNGFTHHSTISIKSDSSFVTNIDLKIENLYRDKIKQKFPTHQILGEEFGGKLDKDEWLWIIDPLDGTTNFISFIPLFCTMLSLVHRRKVVCSAVYAPVQNILFTASQGGGAFFNKNQILLHNKNQKLSQTTLLIDSGKTQQARQRTFEYLGKYGHLFRSFRKFGCMLPPLLAAAANQLDVLIIHGVDVYDFASLSLILSEAGFHIGDTSSKDFKLKQNSDFMAYNLKLKEELLKTL